MFQIVEDGIFRGAIQFLGSVVQPAETITNAMIKSNAAIAASKLEQPVRKILAQESATTAAAESRVVHLVQGSAGAVKAFSAGAVVANIGDSTVSVDLHKNGASILSAAISLSSAEAAYQTVDATISNATLAVDDVLEIIITVSAGTGTLATGVFVDLKLYEDAV